MGEGRGRGAVIEVDGPSWLGLPLEAWLWSAAVAFVAAFVQGTLGFGFAIVSVPVLALVDPRLAPIPQLIQMLPLTFLVYWREREAADWSGAVWTTVGRFPGTALGVLLLGVATQQALDLLIGALVLVAVAGLHGERSVSRTPVSEFLAGLLSGAASAVSSIGGPPIALLYKGARGPTVRATLSAIFFVGLVVTVAGLALAGEMSMAEVALGAATTPLVLAGVWFSRFAVHRVEGRPLQVGILVFCALSALALIARAAF